MKPVTHSSSASRPRNARVRSPSCDDYVSLEETRALLSASRAARKARLAAEDMVSTAMAAKLVNTSRVTIDAWIIEGRCIGLSQNRCSFRLPRWQFAPKLWPLIPKLCAALGTTEGWALLAFLESPHGALGGITPRAAIEQGHGTRVLAIAEHEGN
jgi:hypothetical protein